MNLFTLCWIFHTYLTSLFNTCKLRLLDKHPRLIAGSSEAHHCPSEALGIDEEDELTPSQLSWVSSRDIALRILEELVQGRHHPKFVPFGKWLVPLHAELFADMALTRFTGLQRVTLQHYIAEYTETLPAYHMLDDPLCFDFVANKCTDCKEMLLFLKKYCTQTRIDSLFKKALLVDLHRWLDCCRTNRIDWPILQKIEFFEMLTRTKNHFN